MRLCDIATDLGLLLAMNTRTLEAAEQFHTQRGLKPSSMRQFFGQVATAVECLKQGVLAEVATSRPHDCSSEVYATIFEKPFSWRKIEPDEPIEKETLNNRQVMDIIAVTSAAIQVSRELAEKYKKIHQSSPTKGQHAFDARFQDGKIM